MSQENNDLFSTEPKKGLPSVLGERFGNVVKLNGQDWISPQFSGMNQARWLPAAVLQKKYLQYNVNIIIVSL